MGSWCSSTCMFLARYLAWFTQEQLFWLGQHGPMWQVAVRAAYHPCPPSLFPLPGHLSLQTVLCTHGGVRMALSPLPSAGSWDTRPAIDMWMCIANFFLLSPHQWMSFHPPMVHSLANDPGMSGQANWFCSNVSAELCSVLLQGLPLLLCWLKGLQDTPACHAAL
jgi:hypothetical protein